MNICIEVKARTTNEKADCLSGVADGVVCGEGQDRGQEMPADRDDWMVHSKAKGKGVRTD